VDDTDELSSRLNCRSTKTAPKFDFAANVEHRSAFAYTAADTVDLLVESMTAKSLSNH
jgi:hypothetical protein